jgi:hypothetical protein
MPQFEDMDAAALRPTLRGILEGDLRALVAAGHAPADGDREFVFRVGADHFIRWFEVRRIRVPASELERGSDGG